MANLIIAIKGSTDIRYLDIKENLEALRELYPEAMWVSNGSIGTELIAARYAMLNKIPLFMCIPFPPDIITKKWLNGWRDVLYETLKYAQKADVVSDVFSFKAYQICDERIIAFSDIVVTFNQDITDDGFNSIKFAGLLGKPVIDGFSLPALKKVGFHTGLQFGSVRHGDNTISIINQCSTAVYGNGVALPVQKTNPFETVVMIEEGIV